MAQGAVLRGRRSQLPSDVPCNFLCITPTAALFTQAKHYVRNALVRTRIHNERDPDGHAHVSLSPKRSSHLVSASGNARLVCCRLHRSPWNFGYQPSVPLPFSESVRLASLMLQFCDKHQARQRSTCPGWVRAPLRLCTRRCLDQNSALCEWVRALYASVMRGIAPRRRGVTALVFFFPESACGPRHLVTRPGPLPLPVMRGIAPRRRGVTALPTHPHRR